MLERLRKTLVESFVGAIALGWLLAEGLLHFVQIFTAPLTIWTARYVYRTPADFPFAERRSPLGVATPELTSAVLLLLITFGLLRWLYYEPIHRSIDAVAGADVSSPEPSSGRS